jgi:outer membrane receptor protein involved in Fe transport
VVLALLALLLQTQTASDAITVTATRTETRLADTPSSIVIVGRASLMTSASPQIDDALRQVPGFTLFRRAGSRTANPTAQGVSLRGVGASGASRAVVLDDGIPLNDPFGGWIFWGRVPRLALDRAEVLRGGASDRYGSGAMGGVVQFIRRRDPALAVDLSAGSQSTNNAALFAASKRGEWRGSVAVDLFGTNGYVLVAPESRGAVDVNATSRHAAIDATIARGGTFVRASHYRESRENGTPLQTNDATLRQFAIGDDRGALSVRGYATDNDYAQTFSAVSADRNSERLTVDQRVPSRSIGASAQYARVIATRHALVAGVEARQVSGASDENQFSATGALSHLRSEGRQRNSAGFLEDVIDVAPRLSLTAGVRLDTWRNFDAQRNGSALADRNDIALNPRIAALYRITSESAITASAYRAFRAPTLNELYRGFRVGNVVTNANESLGPERLDAFELGVRVHNVRANAFVMNVDDTIANVTLAATPALITRQRQNLGATRTRGIELESDWHITPLIGASAGYLMSDAHVTRGPLAGRRLPQVPRNQATLQANVTPPRTTIAAQLRWSSMQFDDDLNQFPLRSFVVADAFASYALTPRVAITVAAENLFDRRIETAATPVITLGQPRSVRVGVRVGR